MPSASARSDSAAVVGVVIAGVLASFTIPGPYGWDTTMLGAILLLVLVGYAEVPRTQRETIALAAAAGFTLVYLLGHFLDDLLDLSDWPEWDEGFDDMGGTTNVRENLDRPHENGGWQTLLLWAGLTATVYIGLTVYRARGGRAASG
jgi:hypothetical protein